MWIGVEDGVVCACVRVCACVCVCVCLHCTAVLYLEISSRGDYGKRNKCLLAPLLPPPPPKMHPCVVYVLCVCVHVDMLQCHNELIHTLKLTIPLSVNTLTSTAISINFKKGISTLNTNSSLFHSHPYFSVNTLLCNILA